MTLFVSNIRIGLGPTGIVLRASLTNLVLLNCWAFLRTANTVRLHDFGAHGVTRPTNSLHFLSEDAFSKFQRPATCVPTLKRERRSTLRWHHKIPHTRISRNGIVIDTSIHESDSLPRSIITAGNIRPLNNFKYLAYQKTRFASVARGYSALVCRLQPVDRNHTWIPWRLVCHLAD